MMKKLILALIFVSSVNAQIVTDCNESTNSDMTNMEDGASHSQILTIGEEGCSSGSLSFAQKEPTLDPVLVAGFDFEVDDDLVDLGTLNMYARYANGSSLGAQVRQARSTPTLGQNCAEAMTPSAQFHSCELVSYDVSGTPSVAVLLRGSIKVSIKNYEGPQALLGFSVVDAPGSYDSANFFFQGVEAGGPHLNAATQQVAGKETDSTGRPAIYIDQSAPAGGYTAGFIMDFPYHWSTLVGRVTAGDQSTNFESHGDGVGSNSGVTLKISYEPIL